MKSLFSFLAILASGFIVLGAAWLSLLVSGEGWRRSVGASAAALIRQDNPAAALQYLSQTETPWWIAGPWLPHLGLPHLGLPHLGLPHLGLPHLGLPKSAAQDATNGFEQPFTSGWLTVMRKQLSDAIESSELKPDSEAGKTLSKLKAEQIRLTGVISRLHSRYQLLSAGTSELFHLELASDEPQFYRGGLLAGLPVLKGLHDDIQTLPELSGVITAAGGVVTASEFKESLDELLVEGNDLRTGFANSEAALKAAKNDEIELQRAMTTARLTRQLKLAEELERSDPPLTITIF